MLKKHFMFFTDKVVMKFVSRKSLPAEGQAVVAALRQYATASEQYNVAEARADFEQKGAAAALNQAQTVLLHRFRDVAGNTAAFQQVFPTYIFLSLQTESGCIAPGLFEKVLRHHGLLYDEGEEQESFVHRMLSDISSKTNVYRAGQKSDNPRKPAWIRGSLVEKRRSDNSTIYQGIDHISGTTVAIRRINHPLMRDSTQSNEAAERQWRAQQLGETTHSHNMRLYRRYFSNHDKAAKRLTDALDHSLAIGKPARIVTRIDNWNGDWVSVAPWIDGMTLKAWMSRRYHHRDASFDTIHNIGEQILIGGVACESAEVHHLDWKPSNILIDAAGNVFIIDFDIARPFHHPDLESRQIGTPIYMAPEIHDHEPLGTATDIWSLGMVLAELLTLGTLAPFSFPEGTTDHAALARIKRTAILQTWRSIGHLFGPVAQVTKAQEVVVRALDPDPAKRWPTITAFLGAWQAVHK